MIDKSKLIRRIWLLLWIILIFFTIIRLCFDVWFPIVVENIVFIKFCKFIDKYIWLRKIITLIFYLFSSYILFMTSIKKMKFKNKYYSIIIMLIFAISFLFKTFNYTIIGVIFEFSFGIILPILINVRNKTFNKLWKNIFYSLIINLIIFIWQLGFLFIRNIGSISTELSFVICLILQLDYYVFIIITWIGVNYFMGDWSWWLFGKDVTILKAELEKEKSKVKPNAKRILKLEKAIENASKK